MECPSGKLERLKLEELYTMIIPEGNASVLVREIFRIFDKDSDGSIDFKVRLISIIKSEHTT